MALSQKQYYKKILIIIDNIGHRDVYNMILRKLLSLYRLTIDVKYTKFKIFSMVKVYNLQPDSIDSL